MAYRGQRPMTSQMPQIDHMQSLISRGFSCRKKRTKGNPRGRSGRHMTLNQLDNSQDLYCPQVNPLDQLPNHRDASYEAKTLFEIPKVPQYTIVSSLDAPSLSVQPFDFMSGAGEK